MLFCVAVLYLTHTAISVYMLQCSNDKKLKKTDVEDIHDAFFSDNDAALKCMELVSFQPFGDTADAVAAAAVAWMERYRLPQKFLKKATQTTFFGELAVADPKLGVSIKENVTGAHVVHNPKTLELFRGIRLHLEDLLDKMLFRMTISRPCNWACRILCRGIN